MITVYSRSVDPFYNLAYEAYLFETIRDEDIFLLWQNTPCVVVGSHQNICREVHVPTLRQLQIPVVRRSSGGGTVYHDLGNVNYTYITDTDGMIDYDACMQPILTALRAIGVPAEKSRTCDITISGKKISGSAQRMSKGRVLHHGTLLFSSNLAVLDEITTGRKNDCFQTKGTLSDICSVTNISDHLSQPMTIDEFKRRLLDAMLPEGSVRRELSQNEHEQICRLRDETYHSWRWTWGMTPAFTYEKSGLFADQPISVRYRAKKGIVSDAVLSSPLIDAQKAAALLNGERLDPDVFYEICRSLAPERTDELLNWLM